MTPPTYLSADQIRIDGGTQPRAGVDQTVVADYADQFDGPNSWPFPPAVVFHDGTNYWLADGFHRLYASYHYARRHKYAALSVQVDIRQGDRRDAILHSVGANAKHGLRRTNEDKRRAVSRLLDDAEWSQWSNREIARRCDVDEKIVRSLRGELSAAEPQIPDTTRTATRNGVTYTIDTAHIGKAQPAPDFSNQAANEAPPPQPSPAAGEGAAAALNEKLVVDWTDEDWDAYAAAKTPPPQPSPAAGERETVLHCFECGLVMPAVGPCGRCGGIDTTDYAASAAAKRRRWESDHPSPIPAAPATGQQPPTDNIALSPDQPSPALALTDDGPEWLRIQSLHNTLSQILGLLHPEQRQTAEDYGFSIEFDRLIADTRSLRKEISCLSPLDRITPKEAAHARQLE